MGVIFRGIVSKNGVQDTAKIYWRGLHDWAKRWVGILKWGYGPLKLIYITVIANQKKKKFLVSVFLFLSLVSPQG